MLVVWGKAGYKLTSCVRAEGRWEVLASLLMQEGMDRRARVVQGGVASGVGLVAVARGCAGLACTHSGVFSGAVGVGKVGGADAGGGVGGEWAFSDCTYEEGDLESVWGFRGGGW